MKAGETLGLRIALFKAEKVGLFVSVDSKSCNENLIGNDSFMNA